MINNLSLANLANTLRVLFDKQYQDDGQLLKIAKRIKQQFDSNENERIDKSQIIELLDITRCMLQQAISAPCNGYISNLRNPNTVLDPVPSIFDAIDHTIRCIQLDESVWGKQCSTYTNSLIRCLESESFKQHPYELVGERLVVLKQQLVS
jgi:hypothetical protein